MSARDIPANELRVGDKVLYRGQVRLVKQVNGAGCYLAVPKSEMWEWFDKSVPLYLVSAAPELTSPLPTDSAERKNIPMATGVLDYFTAAIAEVARVSKAGNDQHNPGQPLHWARGKSTDHADCIMRHLAERGERDTDGQLHSAKLAWRALALLQTELEEAGAPVSRGSKEDA